MFPFGLRRLRRFVRDEGRFGAALRSSGWWPSMPTLRGGFDWCRLDEQTGSFENAKPLSFACLARSTFVLTVSFGVRVRIGLARGLRSATVWLLRQTASRRVCIRWRRRRLRRAICFSA